MAVRFGIVVFPGTWSDGDCAYQVRDILGQAADYVWHREERLAGYDCVILPGGFSYGDYLRAGAIARVSPVLAAVREGWGELLGQMAQLIKELPADGAARLHHWDRDPALPRELRRLTVHLPERWRQTTLHQRETGVPNTTNWLEGRFGRIKHRYKLTRGLKSAAGAANFMAALGDVLK